jgi:hypothetical protein
MKYLLPNIDLIIEPTSIVVKKRVVLDLDSRVATISADLTSENARVGVSLDCHFGESFIESEIENYFTQKLSEFEINE